MRIRPNIRPSVLWAQLAVYKTKRTCCCSLLVALLPLLILVALRNFRLDDPTSRDYFIRSDLRVRLDDARTAAREQYGYVQASRQSMADAVERREPAPLYHLDLLTRAIVDGQVPSLQDIRNRRERDPSAVDRDVLASLKKAEDVVITKSGFDDFCLADLNARDCKGNALRCAFPRSILNHPRLYGIYRNGRLCGRRDGHSLVSQRDFDLFLEEIVVEATSDDTNRTTRKEVRPEISIFLGDDATAEDPRSWAIRTRFLMGRPFQGYNEVDDRREEQDQQYRDWAVRIRDQVQPLSNQRVDFALVGYQLANSDFGDIALRDLSFSIAAIALVFLVICLHTNSVFLAITAMAQIFLSFPLAYFVYVYIAQQKYFAALQILAVFLLLGIGADDVFVFTDAWKQAPVVLGPQCDLVTRMTWTYRRAVRAMSVTSVTTAAAFFVTASSPIMPISTLGIWAGILIIFQFLLVITMYPSAIIIWERFWRPRSFRRCLRKPPVDEENVVAGLERDEQQQQQKEQQEEGHEIDDGFGNDEDAAADRPATERQTIPSSQGFGRGMWRPDRTSTQEKKNETKNNKAVVQYRPVERFFRGPWITVVHKLRIFLIALAIGVVGASIYLATRLEPPKENEAFLPDSHPISLASDTLRNGFPTSQAEQQLRVRVTWGITDIDRTGTSRFDVDEAGTAVLDDDFDLRSAAAQDQILDACSYFGDNKELIFSGKTIENVVECWIADYAKWRRDELGENQFKSFNSGEDHVKELTQFGEFRTRNGSRPYIKYLNDQHVGFSQDGKRVVFTEVRFVSSTKSQVPYSVMWPIYNKWQDLLKEFNGRGAKGAAQAIATGGEAWMWQITQRALVNSMFVGIGVMLVVALVALTLCTLNWAIALLATFVIGGIVSTLLGTMSLLGWQLGVTETVGVVISIGYSFDGAAHIATAYVESKGETQFDRTRDALTDLGISILFGAVSTLLAGVMLFPASITFFVKFAALIVITISLSVVWALVFFPALLLVAGPTRGFGSLMPSLRRLFGCFFRRRSEGPGKDIGGTALSKDERGEAPTSEQTLPAAQGERLVDVEEQRG